MNNDEFESAKICWDIISTNKKKLIENNLKFDCEMMVIMNRLNSNAMMVATFLLSTIFKINKQELDNIIAGCDDFEHFYQHLKNVKNLKKNIECKIVFEVFDFFKNGNTNSNNNLNADTVICMENVRNDIANRIYDQMKQIFGIEKKELDEILKRTNTHEQFFNEIKNFRSVKFGTKEL